MKAIMVMFDSLNRHMLPTYGCDWVHAPNFERLAKKTVTFDKSFVGSMPCMPARREIHTGRYNFLHRSWGPIEPFDNSMPEILKENKIMSHLISDHYHYWEEGGANYHTRYSSWEISRGQEGDPWMGDLNTPPIPDPNPHRNSPRLTYQDWVNRGFMQNEEETPQAKTFAMGLDFLKRNHQQDNWFLQLETFDPHEPYFVPEKYKKLYDYDYSKIENDWPEYREVQEDERDLVKHYRYLNAALISMCDEYLGKVLDFMDEHDMWKDTMLIINTDHGFLLGEHNWFAKCVMPFYNEVAHTPLFIWDPRSGIKDERRQSLVQTIDLAPTILEYFDIERPKEMQGIPLRETIKSDRKVHDAALFGTHSGFINCTDGKYVYMRSAQTVDNQPLFEYTHMPTHMKHTFSVEEMRTATMAEPFDFTKGCPTMKIEVNCTGRSNSQKGINMLFDIDEDHEQEKLLDNQEVEETMIKHMVKLMKANDAPKEQYVRTGLEEYL